MRATGFRTGAVVAIAVLALLPFGAPLPGQTRKPGTGTQTVRVGVTVDSEAPGYEGVRALDGDPATLWHTRWQAGETPHPHEIVIDLGRSFEIDGIAYLPRQGAGNGTIRDYELSISDRREDLGEPVLRGRFRTLDSEQRVLLADKKRGRFVRVRALSEVGGRPWTSIAELRVLSKGTRFLAQGARRPRRADRDDVAGTRPGPDDGTVEGALEMARQTLALVERSAPRPELAARLAELGRGIREETVVDETALVQEVRALRRRIILSHPLLDFDRLLITKRPPPAFSHQSDQYLGRYSGEGPGLVILDSWKEGPRQTVLLEGRLPRGSVLHPDLSFDAKRVLFSFCDHTEPRPERRRFLVYEATLDGGEVRQITGIAGDPMEGFAGRESVLIEDWDPCYLPDGGIAFVSTRNQGGVRCHHGGRYCPTYTLHRMNADGTGIRPLAFGEANEWEPSVLHDGRIIWQRWDYINRHDTLFQSLWTTRPDGTAPTHFYGNYSRNPCSIGEPRAIPGSHRVVATATAHHSYTAGSIIVVDPELGQDGEAPLTRVTPEVAFPETEGWSRGSFATPWPLSEDLFLVAYSPERHARQGGRQGRNAYGIYLIDTLGGRELIHRDPGVSCFSPIPLVPRPRSPVVPSRLPGAVAATGVFCVQDVYESTVEIPRGTVRRLRVVEVLPQPVQRVPDRSLVLFETPKRILGSVPVNENGSVAFRAPAGVPLLFQLLDENGMAFMSMRTFTYLHPGETASCVGCHEPRDSSPLVRAVSPGIRIHEIEPPVGPRYEGGLSFARTVQPVLDRHCIGCHGLVETAGGIDLLGTMKTGPIKLGRIHGSRAYDSLMSRPGLVVVALRNRETDSSKPMDYFSRAGRLGRLLLEGDENHGRLDGQSLARVVQWLDLNGQFFGDYSWNKAEWQEADPAGERALREEIRKTLGEEIAAQPYAALVNVALPEESRILRAPLAVEAGGWGQFSGKGWKSQRDPGYRRMLQLVKSSIAPLDTRDVAGTCARDPCVCESCWVREARKEWRRQYAASGQPAGR